MPVQRKIDSAFWNCIDLVVAIYKFNFIYYSRLKALRRKLRYIQTLTLILLYRLYFYIHYLNTMFMLLFIIKIDYVWGGKIAFGNKKTFYARYVT